ncbi:MAG: T9SS type A sorting domain-containing protein [Roseivirga sp.]|nr:T9SS type A sorting domain-containing protein [Roseivirga sp.]
MAQEPTTQPSALTVTNLGSGTLSLSWTGGDGANTIILAKSGSAVDSDPVDATTYTADHFGSGTQIGTGNFVVFSGSTSTALIQGLSASTTYHFAAYEFNTGGSPTPDYLVTSPATTSATTSAALSLYSYQSGNAETADTWTTDSSGETLINAAVPGSADEAVILVNRTVTVTTNNFDVDLMNVNANGILVLGSTDSHDFTTLSGTGLIQSASAHPAVTNNNFATTSGGTFEYITSAGSFTLTSSDATTYNNLIIDNTTITAGLDLTVNGALTLENSATLTLGNDATARTFSFDDITVNSGTTISTNATSTGASTPHTATITGNLTNEGTVDFTAQASAEYTADPTVGVVEVTFSGTESQTLSCGGNTDFYRLIVDKGNDQTARLTVSSTSTSNFRIFGRNNEVHLASGDDFNPTIQKALWIKNGTIELGSNIEMESLSEGGRDFVIPGNGALHINGASITSTTTSNGTNRQGIIVIGKFQISAGSYNGSNSQGIFYAGTGEIDIDGGTVTASQLTASNVTIGTANALSYNQSGGTVSIDRSGAENSSFARFDMEAANITESRNSFTMSGGTLTVSAPTSAGGISIITKDTDFSVTGGTIIAEVTASINFGITVNGSFHNLTLQEKAGGASGEVRTADDGPITMTELNVNGDLNMNTLVVFDPQGDDVIVGGNFEIETLTTYTPGANTTTFDGTGDQAFTVTGTITSGLNNLTINKSSGTFTPSAALTILGDLTLTAGTFADAGFTHPVTGNVVNSGTHSGSGAISLVSTSTQTIGGDGSGVFQNLTLNNTNAAAAPISTTADITVNGVLNFAQSKLFSIGANLLTLGSSASISGSGSSAYIETSGSSSDSGVTRTYGTTGSFTWPIGAAGGSVYTPATINVVTASATGTINITPVEAEHPNVTTTGLALTYYWNVSSSGFSGVSSVTHTYQYADGDIQSDEADYIFGRYDTSGNSWTSGDTGDVDAGTNTIGGTGNLAGVSFIDGDFTAGDADPTTPFGGVTVFYTRNGATNITTTGSDWDTQSTWSTVSHEGAAASQLPEDVQGATVIIASGHIVNGLAASKSVDGLELQGTLNVENSSGHDFGTLTGTGNLVISSTDGTPEFPSGDATAFLGASGGTVTYDNSGLSVQTLPSTPTSYNNLIVNAGLGAFNITLPSADLAVLNDLTISDGASASSSANVFLATGQTYTIGNDLILSSQNAQTVTLEFGIASATAVTVTNDITIGSSTALQVNNTNGSVDHTISVGGSITNNGTLDMVPSSGNNIDVTFTGATSTSVTGTGATTDFAGIIVNKGTSKASELDVNATAFSLTGLTLTNGSFRLTSAQTITPSTTTFTIPSTAQLATSGGTINLATGADDANDLFLGGEIEIVSGTIAIGTSSNNNNNDIEYFSTGTPVIDVQGGTLTVNGQIRRPVSTTSGNLSFSQTGGTVTINGRNADATRAKLEVVNLGTFTMTTGTLTIVRGAGTTYNDLYLYPNTSTVSGGSIVFSSGTSGNQSYTLSSAIDFNDITITGNGASNTATLTMNDQGFSINDLTITEANSTFDANGLALTIGGDFSNTGTFTGNSNTTTFSGSVAQSMALNGTTNFFNLILNKSAETLTLSGSSDANVLGDLTLTSGTMEDGGRTVNITGNYTNNASHTSGTVGTGGISFSDADHAITGTGAYGNITLTGTSRLVTVNSAITLDADLDFTGTVVLDVLENGLTFGSSATITGSSFSSTKMIRTAANSGIVKNFPASATDFTFPIGVGTDYTPVRTNLTTNTVVGTITAKVFNERHPLTTSASDLELLRYWTLENTGLAGATATLVFTYVSGDVQGTESSYFGGIVSAADWSPAGGTEFDDAPTNTIRTVDAAANTITFSGATTIAGEYTAGETAEFSAVDTYFSRNAGSGGNWESSSSWSTTGHDGADAGSVPNGHKVEIASGHVITVTEDSKSSFSIVLAGTLTLGTTIGHDFGTITGAGEVDITATGSGNFNFPASDITGYTGTHDYTGSTDGNMLNTPADFHNLTFSGTSTKNLQNTNFGITNDFSMSAGTVNQTTASTVSLGGSFSNTGATFSDTAGTLDLNGTGAQAITASGGTTTFNNITISNSAGTVTLNDNVDMNGTFTQAAATTMDMDANCIGGTGAIIVNGEIQTSNTNGLSGGATTTFENTLTSVTLNAGSNIVYDATGAQSVTARTDYDGLQVGGSGTKSMGGATSVAAALNVAAGDLSIGANTLTLDGTVTGAGTITGSTTSNISVGGTGDLGTIDFTTGGESLGSLTVNRTTSGTVDFEDDFTINTAVTLTEGFVNLADTKTMTLGTSGNPATITGGSETAYFNTDVTDDDGDDEPEIDFFLESTDLEIPIGYNPYLSMRISCPTCSGHRFRARVKRGPYNTPPSSGSRVTTNVVAAQWQLRKVSGGTVDVTVTLCWSGSAETTGLGNDVGISIWNTDLGSPFWDVGSNISTKSGSNPYCQSRTITVDSNSRIFLGVTNDQSPLPVTLLTFNGEMNDEGNIELNWETADEENNDFFQVQRSNTGLGDWEPLGFVTGNGNSDQLLKYSFVDDKVNKDEGFLYYRLKQVDFNGVFEYSPVISVAIDSELFQVEKSWKVFPNPSNGYDLQMVLTDPRFGSGDAFRFRLLNMKGQVLHDANQTAAMGASEVIDKLAFSGAGIYILEISSENKVERHRLIKN